MADLNGNRERRLVCLLGLILTFGTLACYWPVRGFAFVNLDDGLYVYETRMVRSGLSWPGFVWAFQSFEGGNWNPLVWLSHMAVCQLYGLAPGPHHLANLLLHAASVGLLFLLFRRMTGAIWRSAFVAAIFAWHPLHVESVAWVSERKDVLSTLFWLLTMWAYARFADAKTQNAKRKTQNYLLAFVFFILGLMCKPMLVTLPFVFILLDYWPLQRAESWRRRGLEKLPFVVLSLAASVLAVCAQRHSDALGVLPLSLRLANAAVSYATYLGKFLWPVRLAVFYPYPDSIPLWRAAAAALLLGIISWAVIGAMRRRPWLAVGWFWFLGTLVPVIGLVQVGMQALADRYTYVPYIGLAVMVSWGLADLAAAWPRARPALVWVAAPLALAGCLATTRFQLACWHDNAALYQHALRVTAGNYVAHNNLGDLLLDEGKIDAAIAQFQEVIRLKPSVAKPYNNLGKTYALRTNLDVAITLFHRAIAISPNLAEAHYNLGNALLNQGKMAEAILELRAALRLKPDDINAQKRLADAFLIEDRAAEAIPYCEAVVRARPDDAQAHFTLGFALLTVKRPELAFPHYREALRLAPDAPGCLNGMAWLYATSPSAEFRNGPEAVRLAERACQITKRQDPRTLDTLAAAYAEAGRFADALRTTDEIRALPPAAADPKLTAATRQREALYQAGKPYRDEP